MNKRLLPVFFSLLCAIGNVQGQPASDSSKVESRQPVLSAYHYPGFSFYTNTYHYRHPNNYTQTFVSTPSLQNSPFLRLDYTPMLNANNFSLLSRRDFFYQYDPANPYGSVSPLEGVINGSLDYLLWKLFEE